MKLSIVTTVLNRADTIGDTLQSVGAQTYLDVEHIIQDGGSTDGTLDILNAMAGPRTRIESAPDTGVYHGLNRGIARAAGDVVGVLHSDDVFSDARVLSRVACVMADPNIDGVYGDLCYVSALDPDRIVRTWRAGVFARQKLRYGWMPPHPTLFLRRVVFDRLGPYDTRYRIAADYDAMLRYLVRGNLRLAYIPTELVRMRMGGGE